MSHVKNVGAFSRLVGFCAGLGGYNPGRPSLQVEALNSRLSEARQVIEDVSVAKAEYDNAVNQRSQVFGSIPRLASGILRILEANGAGPEKLADARSLFHEITGVSPRDRKPVPSEAQKAISKGPGKRLAYLSKADSFSKLVQAALTEPLYSANEEELSAGGLVEKVKELNALNLAADAARSELSQRRIERSKALYLQSQSLYLTARAVKKYVWAAYGHGSPEYKQIRSIKFTKD
jgi:hypothetical protein